jgi:hypothetical protein
VGRYRKLKNWKRYIFSKLYFISVLYFMILGLMILILQLYFTTSFDLPIHILNIGGADGSRIILYNNMSAKDPSYAELKTFLKADLTDSIPYDNNSFTCSDYAETVHNNAENSGIRAAYVSVYFYERDKGHACNAFNTTDHGMVYIDCTAPSLCDLENNDAIVTMKIGEICKLEELFGSHKFFDQTVIRYKIYW